MANKSTRVTYGGMNQDISRSKVQNNMYYEARNMKLTPVEEASFGSISNSYGNELAIAIPTPVIDKDNKKIIYGDKELLYASPEVDALKSVGGIQEIIGHATSVEGFVILTTDSDNLDCVWSVNTRVEGIYDITLIYIRSLGFSKEHPIQVIYNYENEATQKIYWVDGINMLRSLDITSKDTINSSQDLVGTGIPISLPSPRIESSTTDGIHKVGVIQYGYSLYNVGGAESTLSPLSNLYPIDIHNGYGGGEVDTIGSTAPIVSISNLPTSFERIKLFSVKYTTFNGVPEVSMIADRNIANWGNFSYTDTGVNEGIPSALSELLFLGNDIIVPKHIEVKENILFSAHNTSAAYLLDVDTRAYSYPKNQDKTIIHNNILNRNDDSLDNPYYSDYPLEVTVGNEDIVEKDWDCVNLDLDVNRFQPNSSIEGGQGKFFKYELVQTLEADIDTDDFVYLKFFKDNEVYRLGVVFTNLFGQTTEVKWMADFKAAQGNLEGKYNSLKVSYTQEFKDYIGPLPQQLKPVSFNVVRAIRRDGDKTIVSQGMLTGMVVQQRITNHNQEKPINERDDASEEMVKMPITFTRGYVGEHINPLQFTSHNKNLTYGDAVTIGGDFEVYKDTANAYKRVFTWQHNKMMQMHSPEVSLSSGSIITSSGDKLVVLGSVPCIKTDLMSSFIEDANTPHVRKNINNPRWLWKDAAGANGTDSSGFGLIGPGYRSYGRSYGGRPGFDDDDGPRTIKRRLKQSKEFGNLERTSLQTYLDIYGKPEVTTLVPGVLVYNNDYKFQYENNLTSFGSDKKRGSSGRGDKTEVKTILSQADKNITLVLGDKDTELKDRLSLDELFADYGGPTTNGELIGEIRKSKSFVYSGSIYNGYSYEARSTTEYVSIGDLKNIEDTSSDLIIVNPGDTFVQQFVNNRLTHNGESQVAGSSQILTERLTYKTETTVNLRERNDDSQNPWDSLVNATDEEANSYNRVYSTENTTVVLTSDDTRIKNVKVAETEINASKVKIPGEFVDSWLDTKPNEVLYLDGKYGPINRIINYNDSMYAIQDSAIARLSINPRVQTQASDGIDIELGTGSVLYGYNYLTTNSGSINKWGIIATNSGLYYIDSNNKLLQRIGIADKSLGIQGVSEAKGLHTYFRKNIEIESIKQDNVLTGDGVVLGYDAVNGDVFTSIVEKDKGTEHLVYNEKLLAFTSVLDYHPRHYINKGEKLFTVGKDLNKIWAHTEKYSQFFYDKAVESSITLLINTDNVSSEKVFNSLEYDSEVTIEGIDQANSTLTSIEAWTNYQKTGVVPLVIPDNLRRRFRTWRTYIPREANTRNRLRDKWIYIKLGFNPQDNSRLILHDVLVNYSE